jgi:hypothetical protein
MTVSSHTITTAPGHVVAPALVGSVTETGAGHSSASTTDRTRRNTPGRPPMRPGDPLSPVQAEVLAALRKTGCQSKAARLTGLAVTNMAPIMRALRAKGAIGPDEYRQSVKPRKPNTRGPAVVGKRKPGPVKTWEVVRSITRMKPMAHIAAGDKRVSPIVRKVEASRAARTHVLEAIHFARKGHVLSSFRCCCGARGRTIDRDRTRGHAELYSRFEDHKRPDTRGTGPRGEHGRLVAEAPMPE